MFPVAGTSPRSRSSELRRGGQDVGQSRCDRMGADRRGLLGIREEPAQQIVAPLVLGLRVDRAEDPADLRAWSEFMASSLEEVEVTSPGQDARVGGGARGVVLEQGVRRVPSNTAHHLHIVERNVVEQPRRVGREDHLDTAP